MCSGSSALADCLVSFGLLHERGSHDGAKWAQNNEFDKLACEPCLTTRCVGAITHMAFKLQPCDESLVLFGSCDFRSDCADSAFVGTRQNRDTLRFARMDDLFLTGRPRVKPVKELSEIGETFRVRT